jgi:ABC-type spermidine/putrescine transport system permease subunit II
MRLPKILFVVTATVAGIALYGPLLIVFIFSFNAAQRGMIWTGFSLRWYHDVWADAQIMEAVSNTIKVACLTCGLSLVMGLGCAYACSVLEGKRFTLLTSLLFFPILTPDLVGALGQSLFYNWIGIGKSIYTVAISQSLFGMAYVAIFVSVRLRSMEFRKYVLAAASLGASPNHILRDLFVPLSFPAAMIGTAMVSVLSVQDFLYAFFCGGPGSTTLSVKLYGMVKFGVNSSINVLYVVFVAFAACILVASDLYIGKGKPS